MNLHQKQTIICLPFVMWITHPVPCIWKNAITVNNDLLVFKSLLEVYYWIQKQKGKKNMKGKLLIPFTDCCSVSQPWCYTSFPLVVDLVNIRCKYFLFMVDSVISYRLSCVFIDQHFRQNTKIFELFKELFNETRQTFHSYIEMCSSSQTIGLVLNMFYYLPINSHSTIAGKRPKGHLKFTFIYDSSTKGIRIQVCMRPLSCWMNCSGYWLFLLGRK